jgi:hypothetical protein
MTSSLRIATLLVGVSIAAAGLAGMALIGVSEVSQIQNSTGHEGKNSYGSNISYETNAGIVSVDSQSIIPSAQNIIGPGTLLWIGVGMMGLAWTSGLCLLLWTFLDDVFRVVRRS